MARANFTLRANVEQMDNGAQMIIREYSHEQQAGKIILKKVYTDFDSLAKDLKVNMNFQFNDKT